MITDQISALVPSPLIGPNLDEFGPRFCDMSQVYDRDLREVLRKAAAELPIDLKEGVYVQFTGPAYETPAEVRMARILGGEYGRYEYSLRGGGGQSHGNENLRDFLYLQPGLRYDGPAAEP